MNKNQTVEQFLLNGGSITKLPDQKAIRKDNINIDSPVEDIGVSEYGQQDNSEFNQYNYTGN